MNGIERIAHERQRQIDEEGWTPEHDDQHSEGELPAAAACYARAAEEIAEFDGTGVAFSPSTEPPDGWPWAAGWWRPSADPIRNLEKAGALIAAEIDRLLRLRETQKP